MSGKMRPMGWNANEHEGREAFKAGRSMKSHRYGDCAAAKDFERAWLQAQRVQEQKTSEQKNDV